MSSGTKRKPRSGPIMLGIVAALYLVTFALNPTACREALSSAGATLKMIAPILIIVFFLMALLNTFVKPKSIAKHLGKQSGLKGWLIALAGGVFSHGPGYVWYPMLADMRNHGARSGLVVAFFYARAIKLPWLPVMVSYFGLTFTLLLTLYVIIGAWAQGVIADKLLPTKSMEWQKSE